MTVTTDTTATDTTAATDENSTATMESEDVGAATTESRRAEPTSDAADSGDEQPDDAAETFPRSVVERLRQENGRYRQRAAQAEDDATRLHTELVRATGRLADPADLPFDAAHLDDPDAMGAALDDLLDAKPHLATRRPSGDIGQGQRGGSGGSFSLLDALKQRT